MDEIFAQAKALLRDRRAVMIALAASLRKFDPIEFHYRTYSSGFSKYYTTAALSVVYVGVIIALTWVDPVSTEQSISTIFKYAFTVLFMLILTVIPTYLVLRVNSKLRILLFLINMNLILSTFGFSVTQAVQYAEILFDQPIYYDLQLIKAGSGKNTSLYRGLCQPLINERDILIDEREINAYTGEYSSKHSLINILNPEKDDQMVRDIVENIQLVRAREAKLTDQERNRIKAIRKDLKLKIQINEMENYQLFLASYPVEMFATAITFLIDVILILIQWAFIVKLYLSINKGVINVSLSMLRLGVGLIASMLITGLLVISINDFKMNWWGGLAESSDLLRNEYENHGWACGGHFDAKGLW